MGRVAANFSLQCTRGATWDDEFIYKDEDKQPIDLDGYEARLQIRTMEGQYGLSGADTLVMDLSTTAGGLTITGEEGRVDLHVAAAATVTLNPENARKARLCYSLELYRPAGPDPEYVIPLVQGRVTIYGETTR